MKPFLGRKPKISLVSEKKTDAIDSEPDEPPVVARLVVEIRSDGTRTIARGALEDSSTGERAAIEAKGSSPLSLASSLAKAMFDVPLMARHAVRSLISREAEVVDEEIQYDSLLGKVLD